MATISFSQGSPVAESLFDLCEQTFGEASQAVQETPAQVEAKHELLTTELTVSPPVAAVEVAPALFPPPPPAVPVISEEDVTPAIAADRTRLIDSIERFSPNVRRDWLETFEPQALEEYLAHLAAASKPRGRDAFWVRTSVARAITAAVAPE